MKARDTPTVRAIRAALGAIGNAGAIEVDHDPTGGDGRIAGSRLGVGAGEADRRDLTETEVVDIVRAEAAEFEAAGHEAEAAALRRYLST